MIALELHLSMFYVTFYNYSSEYCHVIQLPLYSFSMAGPAGAKAGQAQSTTKSLYRSHNLASNTGELHTYN